MTSSPLELVREFHAAFGLPIADKPGLPNTDQKLLRINLLDEEFNEYIDAAYENDLVGVADALADLMYIVCGTALVYGIPLDEIFSEVHRSNMTKLDEDGKPIYRNDGKVLKPATWEPPKISQILNDAVLIFALNSAEDGDHEVKDLH